MSKEQIVGNYKCIIQDKFMRLLIPENINDILDLKFKTKTIKKNKNATKLVKFFINEIYTKTVLSEKQFISLMKLKIAANCSFRTSFFADILTLLLSEGFVIIGKDYLVGSNSREYGLGPRLTNVNWILDEPDEYQLCSVNKLPEPVTLTVNTTLFSCTSSYMSEKRSWDDNTKNLWQHCVVENWNNEKTTGQTNREYGYWSFMPKEVRGAYEIDNKEVREIDIVSSNALMLYGVIYKEVSDELQEKAKFKNLLITNTFYEYLMEGLKIDDREYVKELFNSFICGKRPTKEKGDNADNVRMTSFLLNEFTYLSAKIENATALLSVNKEGKERWVQQYQQLGYELQNLEADIIVNEICNKDEKIFSMHDGVIVEASRAEEIQQKLSAIIEDRIGIKVTPKIVNRRKELEEQI